MNFKNFLKIIKLSYKGYTHESYFKIIYNEIKYRIWRYSRELRYPFEKNERLQRYKKISMEMKYYFFEESIKENPSYLDTLPVKNNYNDLNFDWYHRDDRNDKIIHKLIFNTEKDNNLQSIGMEYKGEYGYFSCVELSYSDKYKSWIDIEKDYLRKRLKELDNNPDRYCHYTIDKIVEPHKEKPYKLYFYGCDDSSFTKVFETKEEAMKVVKFIETQYDELDTYTFMDLFGIKFTN